MAAFALTLTVPRIPGPLRTRLAHLFLAQIPVVISVSNFESPATSTLKREAGRFDSALRSIHEAVCFSIVESKLPKLAIMTLNFFPTV